MECAREMLEFIDKCPSMFHAVENIACELTKKGYSELLESDKWKIEKGGKYFVRRNNSSLIAFRIPENDFDSFMLCSSHSDSPTFKIKENPEITGGNCVKLNIEKYGGMLCAPWFDRPLSVAGRLILKTESPLEFTEKLVSIDEDLLIIPSLAIHMNRNANSECKYNVQDDMLPIFSCNKYANFMKFIAEKTDTNYDDIAGNDLYLYVRTKGTFVGAEKEMIYSPRLDDLECAWTTLKGFVESEESEHASIYCVFDNEEVGSLTRQGANSTMLYDILHRIVYGIGKNEEDYYKLISKSFMLSADNAHALHPNFSSCADPVNRPKLNGGPVIKFNASQKYTTDGITSAMFRSICKKADVPCQTYTNRSDIPGGSTLGNISNSHVSLRSADIGLAEWAMHSPCETAGRKDVEYMIKAIREFYLA